ncbi:MAG: small basic protein [Planctomycetaceae bacterium]|nr:small basic protein [Planctomycetota bacterium]NUP94953.1 small basic protein [Planctomycetaceae bacterium]
MSIDRSLRTGGGLSTKRSVLKRTERVEKMKSSAGTDFNKRAVLGLPKTRVN